MVVTPPAAVIPLAPLHVPGAFDPLECDAIIGLAEAAGHAQAGLVQGRTDGDMRRARIAWLDDAGEAGWVFDRIAEITADANRRRFDFALTEFAERMQAAAYDAGDAGHFDWHMDHGAGPLAARRKLTFVAQLSRGSAYEGGDLEIAMGGRTETLSRARGDAVLFPAFLLHRVTPVTAGTRRSLTLWAHGPAFR